MSEKKVFGIIPMRPALYEFAVAHENLQGQPLQLPGRSPIKLYAAAVLTERNSVRYNNRLMLSDDYSEKLHFEITEGVSEWGEIFYTSTRIIRFNYFVRQLMLDCLTFRISCDKARGINEKDTIYRFLDDYKINSMEFDALKRASLRYRDSKNMKKLSYRNSFGMTAK